MSTVMTAVMRDKRRKAKSLHKPLDATGFVRLYRGNVRPVYAYVAWRVGHPQTAEDITAQVFEKAWRSREGYDPGKGAPATWLMSIARNAVTDFFRGRSRNAQPAVAEVLGTAGASAGETGASDPLMPADTIPDPLLVALSAERRRELGAAIRTLDGREREIISLKFGSGLNNREIAALLEITESNAGTIIYRSLEKIKARLEGVDQR